MRVIVVGTGIAGLITAYRANANGHEIVLVTKAELAESNTKYAQGGIAAALFPDDSVESHIQDTLRAGAGLCDLHAVEVLCGEGPQRVRDLIALGVEFDREANGELSRGHEGAHSVHRVLHANGDATGLAIEVALLRAVRRLAVEVHEHTFLRELLVDDGRVVGIDAIAPDGTSVQLRADVVVLASGGAGQLYAHTTNPEVTTGDGIAAALRAGAALQDVEFYQFHPTSLAVPGNPLVSEAVRGEGAVLLDENGHRFMLDVDPELAELAPRDVVARGIANTMARQGGKPVLLDATALGGEFLRERFPGITAVVEANGFDWTVQPIPVTPAAHYYMGGVRTDDSGRTTLPGLYAVGETSCTGVHGANRLASNSLLESLVFAWRAADALDAPEQVLVLDGALAPSLAISPDGAADFTRQALRELMWSLAGLARDAAGLRSAAAQLAAWQPSIPAADVLDVDAQEDRNLFDLASILVEAALLREESRGAHWRDDFPLQEEAFRHSVAWAVPAVVSEGAR